MTRKLTLILTTAAACAAMPQIAAASCSGSACSSYSYTSNKFTNKDRDLKIHLTGCILKADGSCSTTSFDLTIDANSSKPVPAPSTGDFKVDVKTAAFIGALQQPRAQTLPSTNSVMTTINNETDVTVTVKYRDVEGAEYAKEVKEHSPGTFAIRMDPNPRSNPVKWSAYSGSQMCDSGTVAVSSSGTGSADVTKCKKSCELSMDKKNCELTRDMKDTEQTRNRRDQARTDMASARSQYDSCMATASKAPVKPPTDPCTASREKLNKLITQIQEDDKKLGETEPGAPLRTETVLNTPPPTKPDDDSKKKAEEMARQKLHGCVPSGSPDAPADYQGKTGGVMDGHSGGCTYQTNVGGGRK